MLIVATCTLLWRVYTCRCLFPFALIWLVLLFEDVMSETEGACSTWCVAALMWRCKLLYCVNYALSYDQCTITYLTTLHSLGTISTVHLNKSRRLACVTDSVFTLAHLLLQPHVLTEFSCCDPLLPSFVLLSLFFSVPSLCVPGGQLLTGILCHGYKTERKTLTGPTWSFWQLMITWLWNPTMDAHYPHGVWKEHVNTVLNCDACRLFITVNVKGPIVG